jgi:hypothetical protein
MTLAVKKFTLKPIGQFTRVTLKPETGTVLKLTGTLVYLPTKQEHDEFGTKFSLGIRFEEDDMKQFEKALENIAKGVHEMIGIHPTIKDFHSEGMVFFKLPVNGEHSKFTCTTVPNITPRKLEHSSVQTDEEITIEFTPSGWVQRTSDDEAKCGISCKIKKIQFGPRVTKKAKKAVEKVEDEDELVSFWIVN